MGNGRRPVAALTLDVAVKDPRLVDSVVGRTGGRVRCQLAGRSGSKRPGEVPGQDGSG
jgi:hypothetical protein